MSTVDVEITIQPKARRNPRQEAPAGSAAAPRVPRITRLMALAIKFQEMVDRREVEDYAELARLGYVSRPRLTQIMNLLLLAPDIQEAILLLQSASTAMTERHLRGVSSEVFWENQRRLWSRMTPIKTTNPTREPLVGETLVVRSV